MALAREGDDVESSKIREDGDGKTKIREDGGGKIPKIESLLRKEIPKIESLLRKEKPKILDGKEIPIIESFVLKEMPKHESTHPLMREKKEGEASHYHYHYPPKIKIKLLISWTSSSHLKGISLSETMATRLGLMI